MLRAVLAQGEVPSAIRSLRSVTRADRQTFMMGDLILVTGVESSSYVGRISEISEVVLPQRVDALLFEFIAHTPAYRVWVPPEN